MTDPFYVTPGDSQFFKMDYAPGVSDAERAALEAGWSHFNRLDPNTGKTWYVWFRDSSNKQELAANFSMPTSAPLGLYRVEVFVPGKNATTHKALFSVANKFRDENGKTVWEDTLASIDMSNLFDQWTSLGQFVLEPGSHALSGRVRQYDITQENPPTRISFAPVRWVPLFTQGGGGPAQPADGTAAVTGGGSPGSLTGGAKFDFPMGAPEQRSAALVEGMKFGSMPRWLNDWYDANPFLSLYFLGYHTGADLNSTISPDADKNAPIYACGDGTVTYCGPATGSWGNIIVISHPDALVTLPNGSTRRQRVFSRYGHVTSQILVQKNQAVKRGDQIGFVGLMAGASSNWHLHFDIGYSDVFLTSPGHWPDTRAWKTLDQAGKQGSKEWNDELFKIKQTIITNYVDPYHFIKDNH